MTTEIQGKSILVRVSARFELARVRVIGSRLYTENEKHFLMHYMEYANLRQKLYLHISENDTNYDTNFVNLTDHDRTSYLLRLENDKTSQVIAKYFHLMFQKRKQILSQKSNFN